MSVFLAVPEEVLKLDLIAFLLGERGNITPILPDSVVSVIEMNLLVMLITLEPTAVEKLHHNHRDVLLLLVISLYVFVFHSDRVNCP